MKCFIPARWKSHVYINSASLPPGKGVVIFLLLQKFKLRDWMYHPKNVIALHLKYNLTAKIMRKMRIRMI